MAKKKWPKLVVKVKSIEGRCSVYRGGEQFIIEGPMLKLGKGGKICIHALSSILHYAVALQHGVSPVVLGLAKKGRKAYVHCVDPGEPFTYGGEVVFELEKQVLSRTKLLRNFVPWVGSPAF